MWRQTMENFRRYLFVALTSRKVGKAKPRCKSLLRTKWSQYLFFSPEFRRNLSTSWERFFHWLEETARDWCCKTFLPYPMSRMVTVKKFCSYGRVLIEIIAFGHIRHSSFQTNITMLTTNICEKMLFPSSIQRRDSNPEPSEHESPPITTRPGLPS